MTPLTYLAGGLGVTTLAAAGIAWVLSAQLAAAEAKLQNCSNQRAQLQQSADDLAAQLDRQSAEIDALKKRGDELAARALVAAGRAAEAKQTADARIAEIMAQVPPATEIDQCRAARELLTSPH